MNRLPRADWYHDDGYPDDPLRVRYWDGTRWTEHRAVMQPAPAAPAQPPRAQRPPPQEAEVGGPLLTVTSHETGRNATVHVYADRIERIQQPWLGLFSGREQIAAVTPIDAVTRVRSQKDGTRYTKVVVSASAGVTTLRLHHDEAERFRAILMELDPAAFPRVSDEIKRLGKKWWPVGLAAVVLFGS